MRPPGLSLGSIHGSEISLDIGVIPLMGLLTFVLSTSLLPAAAPGHVSLTYWSVGAVIAVLFVASLMVHELAHTLVAKRLGLGVRRVVLWLMGGYSELDSEPDQPGTAFAIAVAGPAASAGFGAASLGMSWALESAGGPLIYVTGLRWLGLVNVALAVFNLLPGVPLDGGHIVASIVWKLRGDRSKGTLAATFGGRLIGMGIASFGVFELSRGSTFGFWNIIIGLMLHQSARYQEQALRLELQLGDLTVQEVMDAHPRSASSIATVTQAIEAAEEVTNQSAIPILNWSGRVVALIEVSDLNAVPRDQRGATTALSASRQSDEFVVASPAERVVDVIRRLNSQHRRHAAVLDDGLLVGLLGPEQIVLSGQR